MQTIIQKMQSVIDKEKSLIINRKSLLKIFRDELPKRKDKRPHRYTEKDVLETFIFLACVDLSKLSDSLKDVKKFRPKKPLSEVRSEYENKKYEANWKPHISGEKCYICNDNAEVRHHIILLKHGGHNSHNNIRILCKKCHSKIHPWLTK